MSLPRLLHQVFDLPFRRSILLHGGCRAVRGAALPLLRRSTPSVISRSTAAGVAIHNAASVAIRIATLAVPTASGTVLIASITVLTTSIAAFTATALTSTTPNAAVVTNGTICGERRADSRRFNRYVSLGRHRRR